jgi:hypothetical protein
MSCTSWILRTVSTSLRLDNAALAYVSTEASDEEEEDYPEDEDEDRPEPLRKGEKNSHLTTGYKGDAFVVRGDKIGVFRQRADGTVQYQASIGNVQTPKGKKFKLSKACVYPESACHKLTASFR